MMTLLIVCLLVFLSQHGSLRYIPSPPEFGPALLAEPHKRHSSPLPSLNETFPGSSPFSFQEGVSMSSPTPFTSSPTPFTSSPTPFTSSPLSPPDLMPTQLAPPPAYSHFDTTDVHSNQASDPDDVDEAVELVGRTTLSDTDPYLTYDPSLTSDPSLTYDPSVSEEGSAEVRLEEEELEEEAGRNFISHNPSRLPRPLIDPVTDVAVATDFGDSALARASVATRSSRGSDDTTEARGNGDDVRDVDVVDWLIVVYSSDATVADVAEGSSDGEGSSGCSCSFSGPACSPSETRADSTESPGRHGDDIGELTSGPVSNSPRSDSEATKDPIAAPPDSTLSSNQDSPAVMPGDIISRSQSQGKALPPLPAPTPPASELVEAERGMLSWVRDLFPRRQGS